MAFVYLLSTIILLAICPIPIVFTIVIFSVVFGGLVLCAGIEWYEKCRHGLEALFVRFGNFLYIWFSYFDTQCGCHGCKKCLHVLTYLIFCFVFTIGFACSIIPILVCIALLVAYYIVYLVYKCFPTSVELLLNFL